MEILQIGLINVMAPTKTLFTRLYMITTLNESLVDQMSLILRYLNCITVSNNSCWLGKEAMVREKELYI